ncbi:pre-mRNA-processing factor 39-like [Littorina saxatilis]|uniref:Pre-mRNA-processing factor 39 n=1 Tax=Littorina saxatilis TaxID=31220 RepID=A0AAN9GDY7_9CAEN
MADDSNGKPTTNDNRDAKTEVEEEKENPSTESDKHDGKTEEEKRKETELEKYWRAVKENPMDFTGWTYLLQFVEQEGDEKMCGEAYDAFFQRYPYCYGYWKKYSDMFKKHGDLIKAAEVFERGLKAIPLSVDLWLHYINFQTTEFSNEEDAEAKLRKLYERAVAASGTDFRSDKLWDSFIAWEKSKERQKAVTALYDRLIKIPTQLYSHHFDNLKAHINKNHPREILDLDEFLRVRQEVVAKSHNYEEDDEAGLESAALGIDEPPGADAPPGLDPTVDDAEIKKVKAKLIESREAIFKQNENEVSKRWAFEEGIRRPYFHVKPLERAQLKNWREYMDFEINTGHHDRIVVLFERCMIACALYEDFWMKYAKYLEQQNSIEGVRNVYRRACEIHLPKKPYIHLAWAAFEERQGNYKTTQEILSRLDKNVPGLVMVAMRRISLERRQGNHEEAEGLFKEYLEKTTSNKCRTFFAIKYTRYLQKVRGDTERARQVIKEASSIDQQNERLFLQMLDVEYQAHPVDENKVMDVFQSILSSDLSIEFKVKISQRRMEFLEDFGTCIKRITEAYDEHQKLVKDMNSDKRKRLPDGGDEPAEKKVKVEVTPNGAPEPPTSVPPPPDPVYPSYPTWGSYPSYPSYHSQWPSYPPPPTYSSGYNYY